MRSIFSRGWFLVFCVLSAHAALAQAPVRIVEPQTRLQVLPDSLVAGLSVENLDSHPVSVNLQIELVDPKGAVKSHANLDADLRPGKNTLRLAIPIAPGKDKLNWQSFVWDRLRATLLPAPSEKSFSPSPIVSILSVSQIMSQLFELHVAAPYYVHPGGRYLARVRAIHPFSARPIQGIAVQAALDLDIDAAKPALTKTSVTDRRGFATLPFVIPADLEASTSSITFTVTGKLGEINREASDSLQVYRYPNAVLTTDKPLYQPGQMLHIRLLAFDFNGKAIANQTVTLQVFDPDHTLLYRSESVTSGFGIASADWQSPDNLRLGDYRIEANFAQEPAETIAASATARFSRYDLPTFTVSAQSDRSYYLPHQQASVEIRADYLFGEPVRGGHVRLVHETERQWNYREQKWDVKGGATYQGDAGSDGHFVAKVDLTADLRELLANDSERFRDLPFAAYYTDASTGRTEQRRFDVRVTRDPIHVYLIVPERPGRGVPSDFFVLTDYADGSAASCDVDIAWLPDASSANAGKMAAPAEFLRRVHTNRYGLAKVSGLVIPETGADWYDLSFHARDSAGLTGAYNETISISDSFAIRVSTDKTLYRPGEQIHVELESAAGEAGRAVIVEAIRDQQPLASQLVQLRSGHASVVFEARDSFQDRITIAAFSLGTQPGEDNYRPEAFGTHTVLFPTDHRLKLDLRFAKSTYRPGETASADFRVAARDGSSAATALGLVVFDKAVEERCQSDRDFGTGWGVASSDSPQLAGVRLSDLNTLDLSKPLPEGLELVAEALLQLDFYYPRTFSGGSISADLRRIFASEIDPATGPVRTALDRRYTETGEYPRTQAELTRALAGVSRPLEQLRDPWGTPYRARFSVSRAWDVVDLISAGPDKTFDTADDLVCEKLMFPYFKPRETVLRRALHEYHARTGKFIRDAATLKSELSRLAADFDSWRDPWNHPYRLAFGVDGTRYTLTVSSAGPNGVFDPEWSPSGDDFVVATISVDYFSELNARIDNALSAYYRKTHAFPETSEQLREVLASSDSAIAWDDLRDPWGRPFYATFSEQSQFADSVHVETYTEYLASQTHPSLTPVTRRVNWIHLRSAGEDGIEGTIDDFDVGSFARVVTEQSAQDSAPVPTPYSSLFSGASGSIAGTVYDPSEAAISGATVSAKSTSLGQTFSTQTDQEGFYVLRDLPVDSYSVEFTHLGFRTRTITRVPIRSSAATRLDVKLDLGRALQVVEVTGQAISLETSASEVSVASPSGRASSALQSTPKLREYFPETLLWQPELLTDGRGHAHVSFPLADSITTWKLSAIASTVDGSVGIAEKEVRAFQPFFVELDPPRFLTVGDNISLPVVVRNYLDQPLTLNVAMQPSTWFSLSGPSSVSAAVPERDSERKLFRFTATAAVKAGKQQIRAIGSVSDAISRTVTVRPDGRFQSATISQVLDSSASLQLAVPENAIAGSLETTLKIYPNLSAHVIEAIESILERPYGCAEQTISSTYPSVLFLKYAAGTPYEQSSQFALARRYVALGYQRLLSYQVSGGGFSYWGKGEADLAVTAYALRFLTDASPFVAVDSSLIQETHSWLLSQRRSEGYWPAPSWNHQDDQRSNAMFTAYIARVIATSKQSGVSAKLLEASSDAVRRALAWLRPLMVSLDEPHILASYALTAQAVGDIAEFDATAVRLKALEHREGDVSYWAVETNTPFYGWGLAGRVEATALVLQVLAKQAPLKADALLSRALLFLLRNQDRFGIWYSTQATINVLDAVALLTAPPGGATNSRPTETARITVDEKAVLTVNLPAANIVSAPLTVDLSGYVGPGVHRIEILRETGGARASVQVVASFYTPWPNLPDASLRPPQPGSEALHLSVRYDRTAAPLGEPIRCTVAAERVGFRGYGMLLAEIGLPPGSDVDRASLERAVQTSDGDLSHYDVLPDRLIVYLRPRAGGYTFTFSFRPRFAMNALSAPSILYDYYNPEEQSVFLPTRFTIE